MNMKRISTAALALVMTAALAAPAFAEENGLPDGAAFYGRPQTEEAARYQGVISLDGEEIGRVNYPIFDEDTWETTDNYVDIEALPDAPAGYVPMRLLTQADPNGYVSWYQEDKEAFFYFHGSAIMCSIRQKTVYLDNELVEGVELYIDEGVTFLPMDFLATLPNVLADTYVSDGVTYYDFYLETPGTPLHQLAVSIHDAVGMPVGTAVEEFFAILELDISDFEEVTGLAPMMNTQADTVVIGKYAEDADKEKAQAALQALKDLQIQNFTHYLQEPLERAENGKIVESADGKYVMLIISADNDTAIRLFEDGVVELNAAETGGKQPR